MAQWRSIEKGYAEIIAKDPGSSLTKHRFRQMVLSGAIPSIQAGVKRLVDVQSLDEYLKNPESLKTCVSTGIIRPIPNKRV